MPVDIVSDVNILGHWGASSLATSYSSHPNDPLRDDQTRGHQPYRTLCQTYGFYQSWTAQNKILQTRPSIRLANKYILV